MGGFLVTPLSKANEITKWEPSPIHRAYYLDVHGSKLYLRDVPNVDKLFQAIEPNNRSISESYRIWGVRATFKWTEEINLVTRDDGEAFLAFLEAVNMAPCWKHGRSCSVTLELLAENAGAPR